MDLRVVYCICRCHHTRRKWHTRFTKCIGEHRRNKGFVENYVMVLVDHRSEASKNWWLLQIFEVMDWDISMQKNAAVSTRRVWAGLFVPVLDTQLEINCGPNRGGPKESSEILGPGRNMMKWNDTEVCVSIHGNRQCKKKLVVLLVSEE